jgi:hypothetical protein
MNVGAITYQRSLACMVSVMEFRARKFIRETVAANAELVRGTELVGSRNLGLDFDLAWPGVKTGPYGKRLISGP